MSKTYTFRVIIDTEEDVIREIEIQDNQTLEDFHNAIQEAFGFDNSQFASFYISDNDWEKGDEYPLFETGDSDSATMSETLVDDVVINIGDKLLYVFDFMLMWCFYVELIDISKKGEGSYPRVVQSIGKAPKQYSKKSEDLRFLDEEDSLSKPRKSKSTGDFSDDDIADDDMMDDIDNLYGDEYDADEFDDNDYR
jgi:hypothetical protein